MIQQSEIVINGLYNRIHGKGSTIVILDIELLSEILDNKKLEIAWNDLSPIPLNDSWMLQFGFQLFPWGWVKKSTDDVGLRITHHFYFERQGENPLKIEYVHELQNLWFVHTKEELKFSP